MNITEGRILDLLAAACAQAKVYGPRGIEEVFDHMTTAERIAFDLFLVRTKDELAWQAGTVEYRFKTRVQRMVNPMRTEGDK